MKKVFASGLAAICVIALAQQPASAWVNTRFGIGLSWSARAEATTCSGAPGKTANRRAPKC